MSAVFVTCEQCEPMLWYHGVILMPLFVSIVLILVSEVLVLVLILEATVLETSLILSNNTQIVCKFRKCRTVGDCHVVLLMHTSEDELYSLYFTVCSGS